MVRQAVCALTLAVLAGCACEPERVIVTETVEVRVPVKVARTPPQSLATPYLPARLPEFVAPSAPDAVVALRKDDVGALKELVRDLLTRDAAWRAWAGGKD